jgi:hypothetical protein
MQGEIMQNYYVYLHKDLFGNVFYIGKGTRNRAWVKTNRSIEWLSRSSAGFSVELLHENLTSDEALAVEEKLINSIEFKDIIVNIRKSNKLVDYSNVDWSTLVEYSTDSPTFLKWKTSVGVCDKEKSAGDFAGSLCYFKNGSNKHSVLTFKSQKYYLHRVIWNLLKGEIPADCVINHIDNNPHNNNISNLQLCSKAQNSRRTKLHRGNLSSRNKSGFNGVTVVLKKNVEVYYAAYYYNSCGKLVKKCFNMLRYGKEEAFRLACQWRKEQIEQLNANGAGYTDRHGT